jgi:uroporphyrinogen-III synthase
MRQLIERHGGIPMIAPSMRELPLEDNRDALRVIRQLASGKIDCLVLLTGVGTTAMLELARSISLEQQLLEQIARMPIIVRGPKPAAVVHRLGLQIAARAGSPNTWREMMTAIDAADICLKGRTVGVQEYGISSPELTSALQERGAAVNPIPVYRWALPEDLVPLHAAIHATVAGETDITLFTSAQQVRHVLRVATELNVAEKWLPSAPCVGSIGPTCSLAIREAGLDVWFEADPPKMGPLVRGAIERYSA